jgi:hypothetical protein
MRSLQLASRLVLSVCIGACSTHGSGRTAAELARAAEALDADSARFTASSYRVFGLSTEGSTVILLYSDTVLVRARGEHLGETGRSTETYYIEAGLPYLAVRFTEYYDSPMSGRIARSQRDSVYYSGHTVVRAVSLGSGPAGASSETPRLPLDSVVARVEQFVHAVQGAERLR